MATRRRVACFAALCLGLAAGSRSLAGRTRLAVSKRARVVLEDPASKADPLETVRWLPPLDTLRAAEADDGQMVLPVFPLGVAYLPYTKHTLNIFEPRYRQLYNDVLFTGARRFVVPMVDEATGRLARCGVVFYIDDLQEVSEKTGDQVKYVCSHTVIGRVEMTKVLNPEAWRTRETYLKAQVRALEDDDPSKDGDPPSPEEAARCAELEKGLLAALGDLVATQREAEELPRFADNVAEAANVTRAADGGGFWGFAEAWHSLMEQRVLTLQQRTQAEVYQKVVKYLQAQSDGPLPGFVNVDDLPEGIREELARIQAQYQAQLKDMDHDPYGQSFQLLVQAESHADRLELLTRMVRREQRRARTAMSLKKLFGGDASATTEDAPPEERL